MKRYAKLISWAGLVLAAGATALVLANTSAGDPGPARGFGFLATRERPVAGSLFRAVVVVNRDPSRQALSRVRCDAQVGKERLRGRQRRYYVPTSMSAADVVCTWRIPADAGGEKLRLWHYRFGSRVGVFDASGLVADSRSFSWLVKP